MNLEARPAPPSPGWLLVARVAAAIVPIGIAALVAIAWSNSQTMAVQERELQNLRGEVHHIRDLMERSALPAGP